MIIMVSSIKVSGSRLAGLILQVCGIYLLPWARICDLVAYRLTGFVTRCRGYVWYLSFGLLVVFLGFHVLVFSAISRELGDILGSEESPGVCVMLRRRFPDSGHTLCSYQFDGGRL